MKVKSKKRKNSQTNKAESSYLADIALDHLDILPALLEDPLPGLLAQRGGEVYHVDLLEGLQAAHQLLHDLDVEPGASAHVDPDQLAL